MTTDLKHRINTLIQGHRFAEAKELCQKLCKKNNKDAEAWFLLGSVYGQLSEYESSIQSFLKSISLQAKVAITHHNLGLVYMRAGKPSRARASFEAALEIEPGSISTRLELANAMQAEGSPKEAIPLYEAILETNPGAIPVLSNLALAYTSTDMPEKAVSTCKKLVSLQGVSAETLLMLGNAYRLAGQLKEAEDTYRSILQTNPDLSGVLNNLGIVLSEQGLYKDAECYFNQSLNIEPQQVDAYINLANCYQDLRKTASARDTLETAIALHPGKPELHWDLSLVLLKLGQFEEGWNEYEWRLKGNGLRVRKTTLPPWNGEDLGKSTILVTAEQGIGDEIMFSSCYPDLENLAAHVIIDCEDRLAPLFRRSFTKCDIRPGKQADDISGKDWLSGIDVHISAGSIPQHLRKHLRDFPRHKGYLNADPEVIREWKQRYRQLEGEINVGISWKGGHISKMKKRSTSIKDWLPVLKTPGINFINLQYGDCHPDIELASDFSGTTIHHWKNSDPLMDMDNFAAQISALDLVISVDNSTVHLAGALGVKTWLLQPFNPDWRWRELATDSYWYPDTEQFHPPAPDDWRSVLDNAASRLGNL